MRTIVGLVLLSMLSARSASLQSQQSSGPIVLRNIRVVDGTGSVALTNQTIVIDGTQISAVGDSSRVQIPPGAKELDLAGHTALPGLVLLHEHLFFMVNEQFSHALPFSAPRLYLAFGVTTLRTGGTDHPFVEINLRRAIERGEVPGPEIHLTSPYFNGPGSGILSEITLSDPEEARASVRYWAAQGFRWVKVYTHITKPVLEAIVDEAHRHQARVTGHLQSLSCSDAADAGIDNIEHSWGSCRVDLRPSSAGDSREARANALIPELVKAQVTLTATPVDRVRSLSERELDVLHPAARESYLNMRALVGKPGVPPAPPRGEGPLSLRFVKAGGRLVLGSDAGSGFSVPGFASHDAVKLLVEAGFTPLDAIRIATLEGAKFLGVDDRVGSIARGKEADLLIVRGDPSTNIQDLSNVSHVFANGKLHDPQALLSAVIGQVGWR
jgi:imidazolonepropionase-like amidohydrolase